MRVVLGCFSCSKEVLEAVLGVLGGAWGVFGRALGLTSETKAPATNLQDQAGCKDGARWVRGGGEEALHTSRGPRGDISKEEKKKIT